MERGAGRIGFLAHGACLPGERVGSRSTLPRFPTLCGAAAVLARSMARPRSDLGQQGERRYNELLLVG